LAKRREGASIRNKSFKEKNVFHNPRESRDCSGGKGNGGLKGEQGGYLPGKKDIYV